VRLVRRDDDDREIVHPDSIVVPSCAMGEIRRYLDERRTAARRGLERGRGAGVLRRVTTWELRQSAKVNGTRLLHPWSRRKAGRLAEAGGPLRLHLGSGGHPLDGWVNVDVLGMEPDLYWDLRLALPFPDGSASAVFLEHVCEHFALADDLQLLAECRRVLAPGGIVRVGVPDFGAYLESYAGDGAFIERLRPGRPTRLLAVAEVALGHGHRSVWDDETLVAVLAESGFAEARCRAYGDSDLDPAPDSPKREAETVYAEARRP
jgi:predicted SAM-dependent methyltransferase